MSVRCNPQVQTGGFLGCVFGWVVKKVGKEALKKVAKTVAKKAAFEGLKFAGKKTVEAIVNKVQKKRGGNTMFAGRFNLPYSNEGVVSWPHNRMRQEQLRNERLRKMVNHVLKRNMAKQKRGQGVFRGVRRPGYKRTWAVYPGGVRKSIPWPCEPKEH